MNNKRFNAVLNIIILLFFVISAISGIIIWLILPGGYGFGLYEFKSFQDASETLSDNFLGFPRHTWINIHIYSSTIFVILVVLHDILHWRWFRSLPKILRG
jgi:hypothetical protein